MRRAWNLITSLSTSCNKMVREIRLTFNTRVTEMHNCATLYQIWSKIEKRNVEFVNSADLIVCRKRNNALHFPDLFSTIVYMTLAQYLRRIVHFYSTSLCYKTTSLWKLEHYFWHVTSVFHLLRNITFNILQQIKLVFGWRAFHVVCFMWTIFS